MPDRKELEELLADAPKYTTTEYRKFVHAEVTSKLFGRFLAILGGISIFSLATLGFGIWKSSNSLRLYFDESVSSNIARNIDRELDARIGPAVDARFEAELPALDMQIRDGIRGALVDESDLVKRSLDRINHEFPTLSMRTRTALPKLSEIS